MMGIVSVVLLVTNIMNSHAIIVTREISDIPTFEQNFLLNTFLVSSSALIYIFNPEKAPISDVLGTALFTGVTVFLCQTMFTVSVKMAEKVGPILVLTAMQIVFAYFYSIFRYG